MGGRRLLIAVAVGILAMPPVAWSAPSGLKAVAFGEGALGYASGVIRETLPIDGVVSNVTGDNETTGNRRLLTRGDVIYLTLKQASEISPGALYTIYRHVHRVTHPADGRYLGNLFIMVAVVKVIDLSQEPTTVELVKTYGSVFPGDRVMRFTSLPPPEGEEGASEARQLEGQGMIVESPPGRTLIAQGHVVYIDWGHDRGLRQGDRLEVFRASEGLPRRVIGELKVLKVGSRTSSALVTRSKYPFRRGDRFLFKQEAPEPDEEELVEVVEEEEPQLVAKAVVPDVEPDSEEEPRTALLEGLLERLEYGSGEVLIQPEGIEALNKVSELLQDMTTDQHVRVEGHTDNVEIGPTLKPTYPSNWELAKARATEVVRYLVEEAGIDAASLSAVGHADTQPVASNADEEGRHRNRRVEIILYASKSADRVPDEPFDAVQEPLMEDATFIIEEGEVTPEAVLEDDLLPPSVDELDPVPPFPELGPVPSGEPGP